MMFYQELAHNKTKSVSNLKLFQKKLANCQKHQSEIVENITKVKNNMDRVRNNVAEDSFDDIKIENIQEEQAEANDCEVLRMIECKGEVKG